MKIGDKLICKKRLDSYYAGVVGDIEFGIEPEKEYEIADIHHHEVSVQVDYGFCMWFTRSAEPWKEFKRLDEYFYNIKEHRKLKLEKLNVGSRKEI